MPIPKSPHSRFPTEIIECFIDSLADDRTTLFSTSQVCRTMLTRSRYHLFSTIYLSSNRPFYTIPKFLSILDTKWSTIGQAVTHISLNAAFTAFDYGNPEIAQAVPIDVMNVTNWSQILGHLAALKSIRWTNEVWSLVHPQFRRVLFHSTIEHLELGSFIWAEEIEFAHFLHNLPASIHSAKFEHLTLVHTSLPTNDMIIYPCRNIHLTSLDAYTMIIMRHLFAESRDFRFTVASMTIPFSDINYSTEVFKELPDVWNMVDSALNHFGPNLQELVYILPDFEMMRSSIENNNVGQSTCYYFSHNLSTPLQVFTPILKQGFRVLLSARSCILCASGM